jgi:hypothetical protein
VDVYNLVVGGTKSYYVGGAGARVHSCGYTLNVVDTDSRALRNERAPWTDHQPGAGSPAAPPLLIYNSMSRDFSVIPDPSNPQTELQTMDCFGLGRWALRVGVREGYLIVLDANRRTIRSFDLEQLRSMVLSGPGCEGWQDSVVESTALEAPEVPYSAILIGERLYVSYFGEDRVDVYQWADASGFGGGPLPVFERALEFSAGDAGLGLSGMAAIKGALWVAGAAISTKVRWRWPSEVEYGAAYLYRVGLEHGEAGEPTPWARPANVNAVGLFSDARERFGYLLNSGSHMDGYSSLQRINGHGLDEEIRLPENAKIGRGYPLGGDQFAVLQMSGDHLFIVDDSSREWVATARFDGVDFVSSPTPPVRVPDRSQADLHDLLAHPWAPGVFYAVDSKNEQVVVAEYDSRARRFQTLDLIPLGSGQAATVPSWAIWLE